MNRLIYFMKHINQTSKYIAFVALAFVLMSSIVAAVPARAHAFDFGRLIDPLCLFACDDDDKVVNTYTNSNNVNSNINSPGATVTAVNSVGYVPPTYAYDYPSYPSQPQYSALQVSCYPSSTSVRTGDSVVWHARISGGNGSYYTTWTGTDGVSGYGTSYSKTYYETGTKTARVSVTSSGQTVTRSCDSSVRVSRDGNYDDNDYDDDNESLRVTCTADDTSVEVGDTVRWTARASGGDGDYTYRWDGDESLSGSGRTISIRYDDSGDKDAEVTVRSDGRSITRSCDDTVRVRGTSYVSNSYNYNSNINYTGGLDAACFADPTTARVNQPVSWKAEATGGYAPYTYSWTGSDGLTGSDNGILKYYSSTGDKSAVVTIKSADGRTATVACSNSVTIRSAAATGTTVTPTNTTNDDDSDNGLSAAALFSLKNVPWGWVAILIILVLFATVAYLLFNRPKI